MWRDLEFRPPQLSSSTLVLLASCTLVPCILLFSMSMLTNLKVFVPRYLLPCKVGLALLAGWAFSGIGPFRFRFLAVSAVVAASLLYAPPARVAHGGDWRAAMATVRSVAGNTDMPVLIRSGFPESEPFDWLGDETRTAYLFAPLSVYPAAGNVLRLPSRLSPSSIAYLDEHVPSLEHSERLLFVNMGDASYESWLLGRLSSAGFVKQRVGRFGGSLTVDLYFRSTEKVRPSESVR